MTYDRDYVPLMEALATAQLERGQRREWRDGEIEWVTHERNVMHAATNAIRAAKGMAPIDLALIRDAEQQACGHIDYTKKFALGCERLTTPTPDGPTS